MTKPLVHEDTNRVARAAGVPQLARTVTYFAFGYLSCCRQCTPRTFLLPAFTLTSCSRMVCVGSSLARTEGCCGPGTLPASWVALEGSQA
jgi:hypothetical protein